LNTGGSNLSEQEVRNCIAVMINPKFYDWLMKRASFDPFSSTTRQTPTALNKQSGVELALRFFAFRLIPYKGRLNVHEYLDESLIEMANNTDFKYKQEKTIFEQTFNSINNALGKDAFKKWDGSRFSGKFLQSVYEVMATGISKNIQAINGMSEEKRNKFIKKKAKELWENKTFKENSGAGVRGTTRLLNLIPMAEDFFRP